MDRGERRWRNAHRKARRLRFYYEYWGFQRPYLFYGKAHLVGAQWMQKPWQVNGGWFFSTPGHWILRMMTKPARRAQTAALRAVLRGVDQDIATKNWPDYRRPHVFYW